MSKIDIYDGKGNRIGTAYPSSDNATYDSDSVLGVAIGMIGIIAVIVGIIGGVESMLVFAIGAGAIIGAFYLIGKLFAAAIMKLDDLFKKLTDDHANVVWTAIGIVLVIVGVSACHNDLVNLLS